MIRYAAPRSEDHVGRHRDNSHGGRVYGSVADRIAKAYAANGLPEPYVGRHRRKTRHVVELRLVRGDAP